LSPKPIAESLWAALALSALGCGQSMSDQSKRGPLERSAFFADGQSSRPPVPGTVAQGQLRTDELLYRGTLGREPSDVFPFPVTREILVRGRERFDIYCSPCHDRTGYGNGIVVQRGYARPPSYHIERLRRAKPGSLFDVITRGMGAMPDYGSQIRAQDRWAIVAYVLALQESQNARPEDIPSKELKLLEAGP
jgi:mono/diheme cytochrome c family protein